VLFSGILLLNYIFTSFLMIMTIIIFCSRCLCVADTDSKSYLFISQYVGFCSSSAFFLSLLLLLFIMFLFYPSSKNPGG